MCCNGYGKVLTLQHADQACRQEAAQPEDILASNIDETNARCPLHVPLKKSNSYWQSKQGCPHAI